ncbi:AIM24 family protein [Defluviimonas salinarum]|uniref:AIM24 family protein n=1 Tax=Defluviimonas salinarum TaxID=2992147 RepID=A0ABT3J4D4_9RHOB|nr:AIM24 family protein [Defluviimonas salinarum]MCW3782538.1 AIM24 family protein [Defluviimonas salinarum]
MQFNTIDEKVAPGGKIEVVEYGDLAGSSDARTAEQLFFLREAKMRLKSVRVTLNRGRVRTEPGSLYYMNGKLEIVASTGGGIVSALARRVTTGEPLFVNEIRGTGTIMLEPTYGHFILAELEDETLIVDKGMFYAGLGELQIGAEINRNLGAGLFGGEGFFQTRITGTGIVALFSPVPMSELQEFELKDGRLMVDGNFALMRTGKVEFRVEKSSKSWLATSVSGEGLLQVFEGTGTVWIAPTQGIYELLATPNGLENRSRASGARTSITRS